MYFCLQRSAFWTSEASPTRVCEGFTMSHYCLYIQYKDKSETCIKTPVLIKTAGKEIPCPIVFRWTRTYSNTFPYRTASRGGMKNPLYSHLHDTSLHRNFGQLVLRIPRSQCLSYNSTFSWYPRFAFDSINSTELSLFFACSGRQAVRSQPPDYGWRWAARAYLLSPNTIQACLPSLNSQTPIKLFEVSVLWWVRFLRPDSQRTGIVDNLVRRVSNSIQVYCFSLNSQVWLKSKCSFFL